MDELDALRDFRSGGPDLDEATKARIRARAFGTPIGGSDDERPSPGVGAREPALHEVPEYAPAAPPPHPGRRHARWLAAAAAVILVVAVSLSFAIRRSTTETAGPASLTAIDDLASRAAAQPDRDLAPGEYAYVETVTGTLTTAANGLPSFVVAPEQLWLNRDDRGRELRDASRVGVPMTGPNIQTLGGQTRDLAPGVGGQFGGLTYGELRGLPAGADTFITDLMRSRQISDPAALVPALRPLLAWPTITPAARAAAIRALARQGTPLGAVRDHQGRPGVGIAAPVGEDGQAVFVFDGQNGALLGEFTVPRGSAPDPALATSWYDVIATGFGTSLPAG
ncbi:MAG: hypothetical protein HYX32_01215 [Actinobacteria bacterium]|nr:hypothetical protein [Actinomycetota bacterium]